MSRETKEDIDDYDEPDVVEPATNVIIKNFSENSGANCNILATVLAQREFDLIKINNLEKQISNLTVEADRVETKLHYCRLDLNNCSLSCEEKDKIIKSDSIQTRKIKILLLYQFVLNILFTINVLMRII